MLEEFFVSLLKMAKNGICAAVLFGYFLKMAKNGMCVATVVMPSVAENLKNKTTRRDARKAAGWTCMFMYTCVCTKPLPTAKASGCIYIIKNSNLISMLEKHQ